MREGYTFSVLKSNYDNLIILFKELNIELDSNYYSHNLLKDKTCVYIDLTETQINALKKYSFIQDIEKEATLEQM